jgi:hypothetical protein
MYTTHPVDVVLVEVLHDGVAEGVGDHHGRPAPVPADHHLDERAELGVEVAQLLGRVPEVEGGAELVDSINKMAKQTDHGLAPTVAPRDEGVHDGGEVPADVVQRRVDVLHGVGAPEARHAGVHAEGGPSSPRGVIHLQSEEHHFISQLVERSVWYKN